MFELEAVPATSAAAAELVLEDLRRMSQPPKLETVADVAGYLDRAANGGCRTVGELKMAIRTARNALREIAGKQA